MSAAKYARMWKYMACHGLISTLLAAAAVSGLALGRGSYDGGLDYDDSAMLDSIRGCYRVWPRPEAGLARRRTTDWTTTMLVVATIGGRVLREILTDRGNTWPVMKCTGLDSLLPPCLASP